MENTQNIAVHVKHSHTGSTKRYSPHMLTSKNLKHMHHWKNHFEKQFSLNGRYFIVRVFSLRNDLRYEKNIGECNCVKLTLNDAVSNVLQRFKLLM